MFALLRGLFFRRGATTLTVVNLPPPRAWSPEEEMLRDWRALNRQGIRGTTLSPPMGEESLRNPQVQQAMRAYAARTASLEQVKLLEDHWMLVA